MSFKSKIDFCGLADGTTIMLKSHDEGRSSSTVTCENNEGDTIDATVFGHVMDPSNDYALKTDATNLSVVLGGVKTVNIDGVDKYFALKSVSVGTSNSSEVSIAAQSEQVAGATPARTYTVVIPVLKQRNKAQILNNLFTLSGDNAHLQSANYTFSVDITQTTVDGDRVTWDCYNGKIVANVNAKQAGAVAPTFAPVASGTYVTVQTGDDNETRPDSDYASVTASITQYLTADAS